MTRTIRAAIAAVAVAALAALSTTAATASNRAGGTISISYPTAGSSVPAGDITVTGRVGAGAPTANHSVLLITDLSGSVDDVDGLDCNGDGSVNAADDLNSNGSIGDVLDCEIAAIDALNKGLIAAPDSDTRIRVGVGGFAGGAALATVSPSGETFVEPSRRNDGTNFNISVVSHSLEVAKIGEYTEQDMDDNGTSFDAALNMALPALAGRSGNKWVFFMSDGDDNAGFPTGDILDRLKNSGVHVRTFAVGQGVSDDACDVGMPLRLIADTTGEQCIKVEDPATLSADLAESQPANVESVKVTGLGSTLTASIDALGNWTAPTTLTAGSYTATATATFTDGTTSSTDVTFSVGSGPAANVERWDGLDRYDASAKISEKSFAPGVKTAFIASGLIFTDALSGSPISGATPGPMLLVRTDEIPASIKAELARLKPQRIVVLGGPNTVTSDVARALDTYTTGPVLRWDGRDRYEASAKISAMSFGSGVDTAFVASGSIFTDALSGSPIAGHTPGPMLLVRTDEIPDAIKTELARLKPKEIVVLGGPATINDTVQRELKSYTAGSVDRWDGLDRYEASAQISAKSFRPKVKIAFIASGLIFTDALSGSAIAGATPGPMLLVKTNDIPPSIDTELRRLDPQKIVVLGGPATISTGVEADLGQYLIP